MFDKHHKKIVAAAALLSAVGVIVTVILYFEDKQHRKTRAEIANIDLQIKQLELLDKYKKTNI